MGVRGLTTYIANRSHMYLESYELLNSYLVLDGNSICCQLYHLYCKCNDCFGGDYDKFANKVYSFFETLSLCNITPIVIFDGGYEKRKLKTLFERMRSKLKSSRNINSVTEGSYSHFPLFLREDFKDIVLKLKIKCVRCDFEGDSAVACVAKALNCPVLSYDSDFYILDALYIPFPTLNLNVCQRYNKDLKKSEHFIQCRIYRIDNFLNYFGGMDKTNLPLLAILLGNDYIRRREFTAFYRQLKLHKGRNLQTGQQRRIKTVITWLKHETFNSAFKKILKRFKAFERKELIEQMKEAMSAYFSFEHDILKHLDIAVQIPNPPNDLNFDESDFCCSPNNSDDEDSLESDSDECEEDNSNSDGSTDFLCELGNKDDISITLSLPQYFVEKFRMGIYPSCFMDILDLNCYYCIPQVESLTAVSSHNISFTIISAIHKILRGPNSPKLRIYSRNENFHLKKIILNVYRDKVPNVCDIEHLNHKECLDTFLKILKMDHTFIENCLNNFPSHWHLFLISLNYWICNSRVENSFIYSLVMCATIISFVDHKVGFCRSSKSFYGKYKTKINEFLKVSVQTEPLAQQTIQSLAEKINFKDSLLCMSQMLKYFQMEIKMRTNIKLYDKTIVHQFSEFQSCLMHIKYLNYLLNTPFSDCIISEFCDGTFIYNMVHDLRKRNNLDLYMETLLSKCPSIFCLFQSMLNLIMQCNGDKVEAQIVHKRKRKRRKNKMSTTIDDIQENNDAEGLSDEGTFEDENNRFALLSLDK